MPKPAEWKQGTQQLRGSAIANHKWWALLGLFEIFFTSVRSTVCKLLIPGKICSPLLQTYAGKYGSGRSTCWQNASAISEEIASSFWQDVFPVQGSEDALCFLRVALQQLSNAHSLA